METILLRKYIDLINEAVIDTPQQNLSDIFTQDGKLEPEVKNTINKVVQHIQEKFPDAKIIDYYVVGAAVTHQYKQTSDIDTSLVYDKSVNPEKIKEIRSYCRSMESSIPAWKNVRPFQFTPQQWGRESIKNADAAYDPKTDSWIKRPEYEKVTTDYNNIVSDKNSPDRKSYEVAERSIQPNLMRIYSEITKNGLTDVAKQYISNALSRYSTLKKWRNRGYSQDSGDRISQNWASGNIIYKFFDAEGYGRIFSLLEELKNNNFQATQEFLNTLIKQLGIVINDEIGYVKENIMNPSFFRKYIDILNEDNQMSEAISQEQLAQLYTKGKEMQFIKNTPVALATMGNIENVFGPEVAQKVASLAGSVDKTSYSDMYKNAGYVVFQWNSKDNQPDIYIADPNSVKSKYAKFNGELPTDAKARSKIPSLVVLDKLGLDASKLPFFVKKVPTEMISADQVGLGGKVIQTSWGEQTVQPGGFLVREPNGHIYTVAPDANRLPIGYIPA